MKHHVLGSLTAALVMSSFGAPLPSHAQQVDETEHPPSVGAADIQEVSLQSTDLAANPTVHPELISSGSTEPTASLTANEASLPSPSAAVEPQVETLSLANIVRDRNFSLVQAHALDSRQAATLYIRNIPVLTFLGNQLPTLAGNKALSTSDNSADSLSNDPVIRATQVESRLEQFYQTKGDASQISVRWDADQKSYLVTLNGEALVALGGDTISPDTTSDPADDALNVANRLRRLLGGAAPLEHIEGLPQSAVQTALVLSTLTGMASWYGPGFNGQRSASGEMFDQNSLTAAHRTLPFGTEIRVTNLSNHRQVIVRINDRGPYAHGRVLDLSEAAARAIGLTQSGVGMVQIEVLGRPQG